MKKKVDEKHPKIAAILHNIGKAYSSKCSYDKALLYL
jgi:hypothetical protein